MSTNIVSTIASLINPVMKSSSDLSLKCALIRQIFYWIFFFPVILKNLIAQCGNWAEYGMFSGRNNKKCYVNPPFYLDP